MLGVLGGARRDGAGRAGDQRDGGGEDRTAGAHQPRATFMLSCGWPASVWNTTQ